MMPLMSRAPGRVVVSALVLFGIPLVLCLLLPVGWWKLGAIVPAVLLVGALAGCPWVLRNMGFPGVPARSEPGPDDGVVEPADESWRR